MRAKIKTETNIRKNTEKYEKAIKNERRINGHDLHWILPA